jgi:hypothetical protein
MEIVMEIVEIRDVGRSFVFGSEKELEVRRRE